MIFYIKMWLKGCNRCTKWCMVYILYSLFDKTNKTSNQQTKRYSLLLLLLLLMYIYKLKFDRNCGIIYTIMCY